MKIICASLLFFTLGLSSAHGQWAKNGEQTNDELDRKAVKGFGAHLIVIHDPQKFIEEWKKPETPRIDNRAEVKRGETLAAIILFAGCKPDAGGVCNTEVDYAIYKPDGTLYAERKGQPVWKEAAPPPHIIQLGRALLSFRLEQTDPAGAYKVSVKVYDLNADVSFELETKFILKD